MLSTLGGVYIGPHLILGTRFLLSQQKLYIYMCIVLRVDLLSVESLNEPIGPVKFPVYRKVSLACTLARNTYVHGVLFPSQVSPIFLIIQGFDIN